MRGKTVKILGGVVVGTTVFMSLGWSFFDMIVRCRKGSRKAEEKLKKKKWFELGHTKVNHPRHGYEQEYEDGKAWCREQEMQDCYIVSKQEGLTLHALYLPAKDAKRFVLLSHGYKGSGFGDFAYMAKFLHEHNCNLLFIDQRCCGESEGEYITFGAKEQYDIEGWMKYLSRRNKKKLPIYLYGESMGAAAGMMALGHPMPGELRGMIADCGFHSMRMQLETMAADWFHIKWIKLLLFRVDVFCRFFAGFRMKDADTTRALKENRRPILFIHGEEDTYVNVKNSKYNYEICEAEKELVVVPNARHLCSAYVEPERYREKVLEFFEKHDF